MLALHFPLYKHSASRALRSGESSSSRFTTFFCGFKQRYLKLCNWMDMKAKLRSRNLPTNCGPNVTKGGIKFQATFSAGILALKIKTWPIDLKLDISDRIDLLLHLASKKVIKIGFKKGNFFENKCLSVYSNSLSI